MAAVGVGGRTLWVRDLARGSAIPVARHPGVTTPAWTPDGSRIVYSDGTDLHWVFSDGSAAAELLLAGIGEQQYAHSVSPDGKTLGFYRIDPTNARDIFMLSLEDGSSAPFLVTSANERSPEFSPDGDWIAFMSDQSGQDEIYIKRFRGPGAAIMASMGGGREPTWARDGRTLFYRSRDDFMAVPVEIVGDDLNTGSPERLFSGVYDRAGFVAGMRAYDVHPDGRRFMVVRQEGDSTAAGRVHVVLNWFEELRERIGN